jgi:hypothetical protein
LAATHFGPLGPLGVKLCNTSSISKILDPSVIVVSKENSLVKLSRTRLKQLDY